jgi:hypothetical protein
MKPQTAIAALEDLKAQAESGPMDLYPDGPRAAWRSKVMTVMGGRWATTAASLAPSRPSATA